MIYFPSSNEAKSSFTAILRSVLVLNIKKCICSAFKLKDDISVVNGTVEFMVCDDTFCLPPTEVDVSFEVQGMAGEAITEPVSQTEEKSFLQSTETLEKTTEGDKVEIVGKTKQEKKKSRKEEKK